MAEALLADTRLLATGLSTVAVRRRTAVGRYAFVPLAAAATVLVMVSVRWPTSGSVMEVSTRRPSVLVDLMPATPVVAAAPRARFLRPGRAYPRAVPVAAVKMNHTELLVAQSATPIPTTREVSVTPPAGTRAVVMQTSDPRLVVVWLY
jgi:hypothetical protein